MAKKFWIVAARCLVALILAFLLAVFFNGWVFSSPPGSREQGFPFAYSWFNSLPPTYSHTPSPPVFDELPRSGWIVRGLILDAAFYIALSVALLLGYRFLRGNLIRKTNP